MIIIVHDREKVISVSSKERNSIIEVPKLSISKTVLFLAKKFPNELILWSHHSLQNHINYKEFDSIFHHKLIFASFNTSDNYILNNSIGYTETTSFCLRNKKATFPSWLMSSDVGAIHAEVLIAVEEKLVLDSNFDYFLTSFAMQGVPTGLFCYSDPKLLLPNAPIIPRMVSSDAEVFKFTAQHYKKRWIFNLFLCQLLFEKKILLLYWIRAYFYTKRGFDMDVFRSIQVQSSKQVAVTNEMDVVIPTMRRKKYLLDVLNDFAKQTLLPKKVIIIEQNGDPNSKSQLDYIYNQTWPFEIIHKFIRQTGACNARNLALSLTTCEWIFLADDDNRFDSNLLEEIYFKIRKFGLECATTSYLQSFETKRYFVTHSFDTFGSGNSFIKKSAIDNLRFDTNFEFGYGEDADFGMQLRKQGVDVVLVDTPDIEHLKAPIGGFRTKFVFDYENDVIQPKPSPTIMLFKLKHQTKQQIQAYKLRLFLKNYENQEIKNPFAYFKRFQLEWKKSVYLADIMNNNN